jgi:hypothetical protein
MTVTTRKLLRFASNNVQRLTRLESRWVMLTCLVGIAMFAQATAVATSSAAISVLDDREANGKTTDGD